MDVKYQSINKNRIYLIIGNYKLLWIEKSEEHDHMAILKCEISVEERECFKKWLKRVKTN